jgi:hypothetical protein
MALNVAERAYVLASGRVAADGTPPSLRDTPVIQQVYFGTTPALARGASGSLRRSFASAGDGSYAFEGVIISNAECPIYGTSSERDVLLVFK